MVGRRSSVAYRSGYAWFSKSFLPSEVLWRALTLQRKVSRQKRLALGALAGWLLSNLQSTLLYPLRGHSADSWSA